MLFGSEKSKLAPLIQAAVDQMRVEEPTELYGMGGDTDALEVVSKALNAPADFLGKDIVTQMRKEPELYITFVVLLSYTQQALEYVSKGVAARPRQDPELNNIEIAIGILGDDPDMAYAIAAKYGHPFTGIGYTTEMLRPSDKKEIVGRAAFNILWRCLVNSTFASPLDPVKEV